MSPASIAFSLQPHFLRARRSYKSNIILDAQVGRVQLGDLLFKIGVLTALLHNVPLYLAADGLDGHVLLVELLVVHLVFHLDVHHLGPVELPQSLGVEVGPLEQLAPLHKALWVRFIEGGRRTLLRQLDLLLPICGILHLLGN